VDDLEFRQLVERVKLRSPIEVVVSERVPGLAKRGSTWWARCPFHEERTPSFAVQPARGTWRCYGACGEGGDVIRFVERYDGVSFLDALRLLAQACGEVVPDLRRASASRGEAEERELFEVLSRAARHFRKTLEAGEGEPARRYLASRGLTPECVSGFGLGWAGEGNGLLESASAAGVPLERLVTCGLVRRSEDGRPFDFFRARLMIPIADRLGRVVGFGGRLLPGDSRPTGKYVNTPETPLFHKGRLIYGLDRAMESIRRKKHVFLVEGYTDVMAAHQVGIDTACALLGTSTTEEHAALIRRSGAQRVTLVFDGDEAGRAASARALQGLLHLGVAIDVARLPAGRDPCDWLLDEPGGAERFAALLAGAQDWLSWSLAGLAGLERSELARAVEGLFELLTRLPRPVERDLALLQLARFLELPEEGLRRQWHAFVAARARPPEARSAPAQRAARPAAAPERDGAAGPERAYRALLGAMLLDNSLIPLHREVAAGVPEGELAVILDALLDLYDHGELDRRIDADALITRLGPHPARTRVLDLEELARTAESPAQLALDQVHWLERRERELGLARLRERLTSDQPASGAEQVPEEILRSLHAEMRAKMRIGRVVGSTPLPGSPAST
jgi:DNA primase